MRQGLFGILFSAVAEVPAVIEVGILIRIVSMATIAMSSKETEHTGEIAWKNSLQVDRNLLLYNHDAPYLFNPEFLTIQRLVSRKFKWRWKGCGRECNDYRL